MRPLDRASASSALTASSTAMSNMGINRRSAVSSDILLKMFRSPHAVGSRALKRAAPPSVFGSDLNIALNSTSISAAANVILRCDSLSLRWPGLVLNLHRGSNPNIGMPLIARTSPTSPAAAASLMRTNCDCLASSSEMAASRARAAEHS